MKYKHILVALDLSEESHVLIDRAVSMAELLDAKVSFIHIDGTHGEIYPELIDIQAEPDRKPLNEPSNKWLNDFQQYTPFPIESFWVGTGDLSHKVDKAVKVNEIDLLICGHHHDFLSKIISYSRPLIHHSPIDILVVPICS
ncbi:universal stress protein [Aliivibrio sp. S4TY2]|uniref:universal stress protein n=1 Tax=unclassified Aliivibrio TaxID=2645654 RepID=UPI002379AB61|nr:MULTISPECIES: universal stress protein [unclassified Aliivibrio]MDD9155729.1 universal stress protein [Aliivibrio sp. S4TY2]MDD9159591.1 universal stress protein [Aliivibrio sp. S4TY1]MDD9163438.1 universal stress protein [Aliivibrio sp. S4MY2]MDD9167438.1 universal stress protein [Aliivibrio sp. S4MY4]MDD9186243.1 universal stress protein [Aliivibrio sp. S4MY3]